MARAAWPVLTRRELNRALLARQLLLQRVDLALPAALEHVAGIQAQYAPAMYVALWARLATFERDDLTRALERRSVVQGTLMRVTIHLVSAADYWPFAVAVREARRDWWRRVTRDQVGDARMRAVADRCRERLADGPLHRRELEALAGTKEVFNGLGVWLDLVRVPPSGTWERRRADLYAAAEDWLGPPGVDEEAAVEHLVRRYLRGFGPAARRDVASWAGLSPTVVRAAAERMELRRFRDEEGRELVDLPDAPLPPGDTPAPARLLPVWETGLLAHARRAGLLPEHYPERVFSSKNPHSVSTFAVDGAVAGAWTYADGDVRLEPYEDVDPAALAELRTEAKALAAFHA